MKLGNYEVGWQYWPPDNNDDPGIVTACQISNGAGHRWIGTTKQHIADKFVKEIGRKISLTRVMEVAGLDKQERTLIWKDYFNRKKS